MNKIIISSLGVFLFAGSLLVNAQTNLKITGEARVRAEAKDDGDYQSKVSDRKSSTTSRFRLNFSANPEDSKAAFFFQPQFTKIWGQQEHNAGASNTTSTSNSSGALNNTGLDVHQAYMDYNIVDSLTARLGRQEFNLGDQLVVGGVGWHNIGRAFDAGLFTYNIGKHKVLLFSSKVVDENISSAATGDNNFRGLYFQGDFGEFAKALDLYILNKSDHTGVGAADTDIYSFGIRAKSSIKDFDYRFEYTAQEGTMVASKKESANQYDIELGYKISAIKTRFAFEYFSSSEYYDQFYPTAHKWLGFADQFARKNIKGYVFHVKTAPTDKLFVKLDYHMFERTKTTHAAYNFGVNSLGTTGTSKKIADEIDLTVGYKVEKNLKLMAGHAIVSPKQYLKAQNAANKDKTGWSYLQILASF